MLRSITTTAVILTVALTSDIASAQTLRNADEPAEFPPSSFSGRQYVDSRGCVYVRAGFDGAVTWVPRVSRQRQVLCGFQPTFASNARPDAPVVPDSTQVASTRVPPQQTPAQTTATPPPRQSGSARGAPPPTTTPTPTRVVSAPPVRTKPPAKPRPVAPPVVTKPPVKTAPPPARVATGGCPGASPLSQQYLNNSKYPVRCGPQGTHPGAYATRGGAGAGVSVKPAPEIAPPPGYRAAFNDDRFNPHRGQQTRSGFQQMRLVWTSGVPRRLVDQNSGRDVTAHFPNLRFPFVSMKQQSAYVKQHGWPAESGQRRVVVATKNTPPATTGTRSAAPGGHKYVQVGAFTVPSNAQNSAARLQRLGLPVRIGSYQRSGKTFRVVLAGPFGSASALNQALGAARRAGFSDAFTRK